MSIENIFLCLNNILGTFLLVPLVLLAGVYFSAKLQWIQIHRLPSALKHSISSRKIKSKMSSFFAISAVLAGNLGTGNLAGIAVGLKIAGPGMIFWMWIIAILGSAIRFVSCTLGVKYQIQNKSNPDQMLGGPMYYLRDGLRLPTVAKFFCAAVIMSAITAGNMVQINSSILPIQDSLLGKEIFTIFLMILVISVIFNRSNMFIKIVVFFVPLMTLVYISICAVIILTHFHEAVSAFNKILCSAFSIQSVAGGAVSYGLIEVMKTGFERGIFACDIGTGMASILHAQVKTDGSDKEKIAILQGSISTIAPFIVMIFCTMTGLVLMISNTSHLSLESTDLCIHAFYEISNSKFIQNIIVVVLWLFAFTTILTWCHCAQIAYNFLFPNFQLKLFRIFFACCIPIGFFVPVKVVWLLADISLSMMFLINIFAVFFLCKKNQFYSMIKKNKNFIC